ncbi:UDP-D-galactose:(glucosyl)lipopolysaccharide-1, 6-D-galactosyltransferase [Salmonella enterica subsp. enterica]|uniref:UDP-D-galactose:(Glucosyl)lipopolysaccharide-1, 6-D-galactosyltransferase n=1 Tax=Salmonella enterica I TaxID=59201 RepID=A0A3S4JF37_SALET|nr:UDP-D-galactose:(glucosyl)lipopolysaccharide-1, 6-D-galactosyltransferase [Salmonella enterica subsp. enterica]
MSSHVFMPIKHERKVVNSYYFLVAAFSLDHKKHAECITYADYHLAISSGIKEQMMARGISAQNISVVYNPVSIKTIIVPSPERDKPAVFLYVGRLKFEGQKRVKDLFDGLARTTGEMAATYYW